MSNEQHEAAQEAAPEPSKEEVKESSERKRKPRQGGAQVPTVGRILHYVTSQGTIRPAVIVGVIAEDEVQLVVFNSKGSVFVPEVTIDPAFPGETPGTAFWPPR